MAKWSSSLVFVHESFLMQNKDGITSINLLDSIDDIDVDVIYVSIIVILLYFSKQ